jgi:hypothetical protein
VQSKKIAILRALCLLKKTKNLQIYLTYALKYTLIKFY